MACLDTDVLIELMGGSGAGASVRARRFVEELVANGEPLVTTRFNVAELFVGVRRSNDPRAEIDRVSAVTDAIEVLEFDAPAAERFGSIMADLQRVGQPVGDLDALISATAMRFNHGVVTRNVRHFSRIPGLTVLRME